MDDANIVSLPDALQFSTVCVVSITVGPVYEWTAVSTGGMVVAAMLMTVGVMFMAMPIAIVGTCFSQTWFDQDRIILVDKVRSRMKHQGYSTDDLREVFDEVDENCTGAIEFEEFKKMIDTFYLGMNLPKIR